MILVAIIAGLGYAGMLALATLVDLKPRDNERPLRVPSFDPRHYIYVLLRCVRSMEDGFPSSMEGSKA